MDDIAIRVESVSKDFLLPHDKAGSIKNIFTHVFTYVTKQRTYERQHALRDVSLEIKKGEFFGIVGRNGSGKSTLLKMLAGIYQPTKGKIQVNGKLVPFIELGVGFNPELTGRQNVYLNGALLGFTEQETDAQYDEIVAFAELEEFMDQKLKNYSSGMQVRLAFSAAIRAKADILLIDEVLAVGDADFQRKCFDYFKELKNEQITVVFVSHNMNAVRQFCDKAVLIDKGVVKTHGKTEKVAQAYTELFIKKPIKAMAARSRKRWGESPSVLRKVKLSVNSKEITIQGKLVSNERLLNPVIGFVVKNMQGVSILGVNSQMLKLRLPSITEASPGSFKFNFENILSDGQHTIDLAVVKEDGVSVIDWWSEVLSFSITKDYISPYNTTPQMSLDIEGGEE